MTEQDLLNERDATFRDENSDAWKLKGPTKAAEARGFFGNLIATLSGLMNFGTYTTSAGVNNLPAGTVLDGTSVLEALKLMTSRPFSSATVIMDNITTPAEEGSAIEVTVKGSISLNDEITILSRKVLKNGADWQIFEGNSYSFPDTIDSDTTYKVEVMVANNGSAKTVSAERKVDFDLYHYYGPDVIAPTGITAKNLAKIFRAAGNSFTLNTGTTAKDFYLVLAPGEKLLEVKDEDAANTPVTGFYTLVSDNFSVNDAAGVPVPGYKLLRMSQSVPNSTNHRHNVTLTADN